MGVWVGLEAPVQLPQCSCSSHQHSHTCGMTVSILHPSNIFQKLGGDLKTIPGGDGCLEPNSENPGWGRVCKNIFPPQCELDSPLSPTGNTLLCLEGNLQGELGQLLVSLWETSSWRKCHLLHLWDTETPASAPLKSQGPGDTGGAVACSS